MNRILSLSALLSALLFLLTACGGAGNSTETDRQPTWQEQYDLGVRYLSEGNYEEAILAFTAAIEIDPKRAQAYVGRGDAYLGAAGGLDEATQARQLAEYRDAAASDYLLAIELDEYHTEHYQKLAELYVLMGREDDAIAILWRGYETTGEENLKADLEEIEPVDVAKLARNIPELLFEKPLYPEMLLLGSKPFWEYDMDSIMETFPGGMTNQDKTAYWPPQPNSCQFSSEENRVCIMYMNESDGLAGISVGMGLDDVLVTLGLSSAGINFVKENPNCMFRIDDGQCVEATCFQQQVEGGYDIQVSIYFYDRTGNGSIDFILNFTGSELRYMQADLWHN